MIRDVDRSSIDELLRAAKPSSVAEALGIAVVRRGANLRCICPFHDDNDPSLVLYDNWESRPPHHHCYVCGADGDIFDMVKQVRNLSFGEAAEWLRSAFGLPQLTPRTGRGKGPRRDAEPDVWDGSKQSAFNFAADLYRENNDDARLAIWLNSRSLPTDIANRAGLSFAVGGTLAESVAKATANEGWARFEAAMLEEVGLLRRIKRATESSPLFGSIESRYRDFFFDARIIFPIQSMDGEVIGFAGRAVNDVKKGAPKYLYSPGLAKSAVLYRANSALSLLIDREKAGERKEIYVCEGLIDALRLESLGYPAVSILGAQASKEQIEQLRRIADAASPAGELLVHIFLDRDKAGIRGSSKLAQALAEAGLDADFVWPSKAKLLELGVSPDDEKDPDSLLSALDRGQSEELIRDSLHPSALPVIASKVGNLYSVDEVLKDETWKEISLGVRYRVALGLTKSESEAHFLLNEPTYGRCAYLYAWLNDVEKLRKTNTSGVNAQREAYSAEFIADELSRLNVARVLAKAGADRGEVPTDEAAWRRLESGATAFNVGLRERLREPTFEPLEPFDAVFVARDFEKQNPRIKAMPCPEDLVLQQYMLLETLTERFDVLNEGDCFSLSIPAVRYYRGRKQTITTAEDGQAGANTQTLSFAYQIDMDVLEGRSKASNQGMFRPYIECWRDFIASLRKTANGFEEIYALRLDLKRYYDRLYQSVVRDALREPLREAISRLERTEREEEFAPSFRNGRNNISDSLVDWFCEQSFGYQYYHPETGRITKSEAGIGIPQGPVLSAWLATVALFPLDSELRRVLGKFNEENGKNHAGYARYVDDIFLIADSPQILEELRLVVEETCARLRLDAIPKGELAPRMSPEEFNELLTEGKALIGSGPAREIGLLSLGDGESGFETWSDPIQRASALVLLSDRRLYESDTSTIKNQLFTAVNAHDLRPAELSKVSRWIWYAVAKEGHTTVPETWHSYWTIWSEVVERLAPKLKADPCPWLDPSLYALDGLELLLRSANTYDRNLTVAAEASRKRYIGALSRLAIHSKFFLDFAFPQAAAPIDAGRGVLKLRRMFVQRAVCVRWIARQMHQGESGPALLDEFGSQLGLSSNEMSASLVRAWFTDFDGDAPSLDIPANVGNRLEFTSSIRPLILWLHEAIVLLGHDWKGQQDPLDNIRGKLIEPSKTYTGNGSSELYRFLQLWQADFANDEQAEPVLRLNALSALLAVCHVDGLVHCLSRRTHLLDDLGDPLPALPGIPLTHIVLKKSEQNDKTKLQNISQLFTEGRPPPSVDYRVASGDKAESIEPEWQEIPLPVKNVHLVARRAAWLEKAAKIWDTQPCKIQTIGARELQWAADCFDALARVNHDLEHHADESDTGELMEFVPAWPFICASSWASDSESENSAFGLFGPVVPRSHLANFAFARDGKGRLRTHEVPLADARLWRIGYAVTDALGMVDELERFQALEVQGQSININTAQYVLSRLLGRLRGEGQPAAPGLPHPVQQHLTGSTFRALSLLRSFPTSGDGAEEVQFLLAVEAETAAMRLQNNGHSESSRPGILVSMLAELAPSVFSRLTVRQLEALPELAPVDGPWGAERRAVAAWRLLDRRLGTLEACLITGVSDESKCGWNALRRSVRVAAITSWIRALVFEMHLSGDASPSIDVVVPPEWQIDDPALSIDMEDINVGELFRDALTPKGRLSIVATITPLGWLALMSNQLNLYGTGAAKTLISETLSEPLRSLMTGLAQQLGSVCLEDEREDDKWPFEACSRIEAILDDVAFESGFTLLASVQSAIGYQVRNCKSHTWGLPPQSKSFTDEGGRQWPLLRGLIDQVGRDRHVEIDEADDRHRIWTQTTNAIGKLVGVSVLGETFARTAGMQGLHSLFEVEVPKLGAKSADTPGEPVHFQEKVNTVLLPDEVPFVHGDYPTEITGIAEGDEKANDQDDEPSIDSNSSGSRAHSTSDAPTVPPSPFFKNLRELQMQEWRRRSVKSPGHVRFAVFQFRIDDSYYHPIVDTGFPDSINKAFCSQVDIDSTCGTALAEMAIEREGTKLEKPKTSSAQRAKASLSKPASENEWDRSELVPSWNEHRRRRLIEEAIRACHEFDVDVLVLPEYSVRPDTVEWLRDRLTNLPNKKLSVVAGTYRLHGTPRDLYFTEAFGKIFGEMDEQKVFAPGGRSMEKSAYLTLLQPLQGDVPGAVGVFTRRKKFHSMAMCEFINPSGEEWAPLASLDGLVTAVSKARKEANQAPLDVKQVVSIAQKIRPVERMAELICSELFASTHPVNHETIRSEYRSLRQRFGNGAPKDDQVLADIKKLTAALQLDDRVDRRTILVVPACTTRSADYWIYGQSALLAAGLTTVFCAAVIPDAKAGYKGGGSCFIARSSWSMTRDTPGHLLNATPYSGWSRGIYYNRQEDVLTKREQAVVIADIDPVYMNEGKPRPQALPLPMQLVAHLPVVEMVDPSRLAESYTVQNGGFAPIKMPSVDKLTKATSAQDINQVAATFGDVSSYLKKVRTTNLIDAKAQLANGKELASEAARMKSFFAEPSGWSARLECWSRNWREMPFYGCPPALVDWLPVDLSPTNGELPKIFVPPWGADYGGPASLADEN